MMHLFAETGGVDSGVLIGALFAGLVPMFAGFYAFAKYVLNNSKEERKEDRNAFLATIEKTNTTTAQLSDNIVQLSDNIAQQHAYDKAHNGTSDELVSKQIEAMNKLSENIIARDVQEEARQVEILNEVRAIGIKNQQVDSQTVHKQIIEETVKKDKK